MKLRSIECYYSVKTAVLANAAEVIIHACRGWSVGSMMSCICLFVSIHILNEKRLQLR